MYSRRFGLILVGFAFVVLPWTGLSQEKGKRDGGDKDKDGLLGRVLNLVPSAHLAELKLSDEQRGQVQKLELDYRTTRMKSLMGAMGRVMAIVEDLENGDEAKEVAPVLALAHEITGGLLEARRTRMNYEKKLIALLNPEQQTKLASLKERGPRQGGASYHFYPTDEQDKLRLTEQQKKRLEVLQREMETKLREFLTPEQQKIFDEIRKAATASKEPEKK